MDKLFGAKLMKTEMITADQLKIASERQRLHGGRLGHNIVSLGFMKEEDLSTFFNAVPVAPTTVEDTGLVYCSQVLFKIISRKLSCARMGHQ